MTDIEAALVAEGKYKQGLPEVGNGTKDLGYVLYSGSRDELNAKLKQRDIEVERLIAERDEALEALRNLRFAANLAREILHEYSLAADGEYFNSPTMNTVMEDADAILSKYEAKP